MSSFILKILALFFMIVDHIGFIFFPGEIIFRTIGRLALPLFAYQMAVGFSHTKNKKKHILKLLSFAIICQIPYMLMLNIYNVSMTLNILFTFVLALLSISILEKIQFDKTLGKNFKFKTLFKNCFLFILSIGLILLGNYINVDYTWYGILLTIIFYFTLKNKALSVLLFFILINIKFLIGRSTMDALAYASLFDIIFLLSFNGKKGYSRPWVFYLLYFMHFVLLLLIKHFITN